jgi:phosphatidylglycerol lysyltransferase
MRDAFERIVPFLGLLFFAGALLLLRRELGHLDWVEVRGGIAATSGTALLLAFLLTALSFLVLSGYDRLALRYAREPLERARSGLAAFLGYAFGNALGMPTFTAAPVRYRLYSAWGLSADQVLRVVVFCTVSFWVALLGVSGLVFLLQPVALPAAVPLPEGALRPVGGVLLLLVAGYLAWAALGRSPIRVIGIEFRVPGLPLALRQLALGAVDWTVAALVLFVLLPVGHDVGFLHFLALFLAAQAAGQLSRVPGGVGVVEAVLILLLPDRIGAGELVASLLVWRGIYTLAPLMLGVFVLGLWEFRQRRAVVGRTVERVGRGARTAAPVLLGGGTFVAGLLLLTYGAVPAPPTHLAWVEGLVPPIAFELSHFLASVIGAGLLLLAWGLLQRLDTAYHMTLVLLGAGVLLSLLRGFELLPAATLGLLLLALLPAREEFFRESSLRMEPFSAGWVALIGGAVLLTAWLGFLSHAEVQLSSDLWWSFTLSGDAPRSLRALTGASFVLLLFGASRILRPAIPPGMITPDQEIPAEVEAAARGSARAAALVSLTGDKSFLLSKSRKSFIMYAVEGRSWVSLGDPVGDPAEEEELIWRFRKVAYRYGGWPVFYQVRPDRLPHYLSAGLSLLKLGEEARVPLGSFALEGPRWKEFRQAMSRAEREGVEFAYLAPQEVPPLLGELREVSDAWLRVRNTREKGFSVGSFDEAYLVRTPMGVARREGRIVGFVNVLEPERRTEMSADLMRYRPDAMKGVMEFLFAHLLLQGKAAGYEHFSLGMAPLSGLETRPLAPLWDRLGTAVFRHGEHFYNFQGVRAYKEKYGPEWEPRYLASPGGLALPRVLGNLATLIGGGIGGVVRR